MKSVYAIVPPLAIIAAGAFLLMLTWVGALMLLFGAVDAWGRHRDYKYLSRFRNLPERLVRYYGQSFCGRWMVSAIDPIYRHHYREFGYRWYHILPDNFFKVIFKVAFWRNLIVGHVR